MKTELANDSVRECYVVEIDGIATAEYCVFVKALSASLRLKHEFPNRTLRHCRGSIRSIFVRMFIGTREVANGVSVQIQAFPTSNSVYEI